MKHSEPAASSSRFKGELWAKHARLSRCPPLGRQTCILPAPGPSQNYVLRWRGREGCEDSTRSAQETAGLSKWKEKEKEKKAVEKSPQSQGNPPVCNAKSSVHRVLTDQRVRVRFIWPRARAVGVDPERERERWAKANQRKVEVCYSPTSCGASCYILKLAGSQWHSYFHKVSGESKVGGASGALKRARKLWIPSHFLLKEWDGMNSCLAQRYKMPPFYTFLFFLQIRIASNIHQLGSLLQPPLSIWVSRDRNVLCSNTSCQAISSFYKVSLLELEKNTSSAAWASRMQMPYSPAGVAVEQWNTAVQSPSYSAKLSKTLLLQARNSK